MGINIYKPYPDVNFVSISFLNCSSLITLTDITILALQIVFDMRGIVLVLEYGCNWLCRLLLDKRAGGMEAELVALKVCMFRWKNFFISLCFFSSNLCETSLVWIICDLYFIVFYNWSFLQLYALTRILFFIIYTQLFFFRSTPAATSTFIASYTRRFMFLQSLCSDAKLSIRILEI